MILTALERLYNRLEADPDVDIETTGYSRQKIGFIVLLRPDGTLQSIEPPATNDPKRPNIQLRVLGGAKPTGSGINPCFLWDNPGYALGVEQVGKEGSGRALRAFEAFRRRHLDAESEVDDPHFAAVCRFLEAWTPERGAEFPFLSEPAAGFGVFRIQGEVGYVHDRQKVRDYWRRQTEAQGAGGVSGQCLVSGEETSLARIHEPKIKGVRGAQSSGALLVSFNKDAFTSYGKDQGLNAPVGEDAVFRYAVALNFLLRRELGRTVELGPDATVVFWADAPTLLDTVFADFCAARGAEDEEAKKRAQKLPNQIAKMQRPEDLGPGGAQFYVLGLSPNASRLSVRLWKVSTIEEMAQRLRSFYAALEIEREFPDNQLEYPSLWRLLLETVREAKDVPAQLFGAVVRAVLDGGPLPEVWLRAVVNRVRADREVKVNYYRAASIKAVLNRNHCQAQEIAVSLDPDRPEPAYHLGRLFAVLEQIQNKALPGLNVTIVDRWFASASATPASSFPILLRLAKHHLAKIESVGIRRFYEGHLQEIMNRIDKFTTRSSLAEQGLFMVGYYHQRRELFQKKSDKEEAPEAVAAGA